MIAAARQVDQSRERVKNAQGGSDSSVTQDLLNSLTGLRNARNGLISSWFNYEVARIGLFIDLELLLLDERGRWTNEDERLQYTKESIDPLLPEVEGIGEETETGEGQEDDELDRATSNDTSGIESDIDKGSPEQTDPVDPPEPDAGPLELPDLEPSNDGKVIGNESSQKNWSPESSRASRTSSNRRFSTGSVLRR